MIDFAFGDITLAYMQKYGAGIIMVPKIDNI
jgi:hypothetical protein